jgi:hypothetical protein
MVEHWLFTRGVPTYKTQIFVDLPASAENSIELGNTVPENIGWIYGLSINVGGTKPMDASKNLISLANSYDLWLILKYGSSDFIDQFRLSNMVYNTYATARSQVQNYMPVSIPMGTDWKKSTIQNMTSITSVTIMLDIYFIDIPTYKNLTASGVIWERGIKPNG